MQLLKAQADAVAITAAKDRGELVEASAVEREWTAILGAVRAGCVRCRRGLACVSASQYGRGGSDLLSDA
jgi:hypothetical protein